MILLRYLQNKKYSFCSDQITLLKSYKKDRQRFEFQNRNIKFSNSAITFFHQSKLDNLIDSMSELQKITVNISRNGVKLPEEEEQQQLSYQTNKLAQFIELQLSDLQNTLHYIQKKHSINQIKESISHAYSIFSETEPVFRELKIVFIYDKMKKLVNCFSIIYLILMERLEKPSKYSLESDFPKNIDVQQQSSIKQGEQSIIVRRSEKNKSQESQIIVTHSFSNGARKPKPLGGVHLYNQQYNRHIESDLDRLKRKLKEQTRDSQESSKPQISEKQKLKQQIFKEINTDIYGSPSPDELTLFFNLNSNKYGSDLQYVTFQDQLQQLATFFKESQDEALQFLNKSKDDFIFLNFNQGFKEVMVQYKVEKQEQVNCFVEKVKNLFDAIKTKTVERQNEINYQIVELKKLQQKIKKPFMFEIQTQTSFNYEEEILRLKKKIQEVEINYQALQNYHNKENQNDSKSITLLEHKIAFKDHEISILKKQLEEKNHFIDFLNEKINNGTDPKVLRKISNIYRSHSKKNSSKIKVELEQLQKDAGIDIYGFRQKSSLLQNGKQADLKKGETIETQGDEVEGKSRPGDVNSFTFPLPDYERPSKKKRKQGISFVGAPQKRHTSYGERNSSFNIQNAKIQQENSEILKNASGDPPLNQENYEGKADNGRIGQSGPKKGVQRSMVKPEKRKSQDVNSLQMFQKSNLKNYDTKRSAFASGFNDSKQFTNTGSRFAFKKRDSSAINQDITQDQVRSSIEEEELMRQINGMGNDKNFDDDDDDYEGDPNEYESSIDWNDQNMDQEGETNLLNQIFNKKVSLNRGRNSEIVRLKQNNIENQTKNVDPDFKKKSGNQSRGNSFIKSSIQQTEVQKMSPFSRKQSGMLKISQENSQNNSKHLNGKNQRYSGRNPHNTPLSENTKSEIKISVTQRQNENFTLSSQQNGKGQNLEGTKRKKRKNQSQKQKMQADQQQEDVEFSEDQKQSSENSYDDETRFLQTFSESSNFDNLNSLEKNKFISTYFTTVYKEKKIKSSNLCSGIISISLQNEATKDSQKQKNTKIQVQNNQSNSRISKDIRTSNLANQKGRMSRAQEAKEKRKNSSSSGNLADMNRTSMKESFSKFKHNQTSSQNFIENLASFDVNPTNETDANETGNEHSGRKEQEKSISKTSTIEKQSVNSPDYQKIYGVSSSCWNKNKKQNIQFALLNPQEKQKVQEFLEKAAMKAAIKSKNIEEFKAKIKKMHMSKCGQTCKHLERYLENFNKYRSCNRQTLKIHIENVHNFINQNNESLIKSAKENSVSLPSLGLPNAVESSKGFQSIQRNLATGFKK